MVHRSVSYVDLLLELSLFSTTHLGLNSHITEQPRIEYSQENENNNTNYDLLVSPGSHLVTTQEQNGVVQGYDVSVPIVLAVETIDSWVDTGPNEVEWWDPNIIVSANEVPEAADDVHDNHKQEYDVVDSQS